MHTVHLHDRKPVIIYFHPWELDPDQPRLEGSWKSRCRHYTALDKTEVRLEEILSRRSFQPLINLVRELEALSRAQFLNFGDLVQEKKRDLDD
jgi:hypothetical protein